MAYVIGENCVDVKDRGCAAVCPVDCIHEVGRMLIIDPEDCIDCGACVSECPVGSIFADDDLPDGWLDFVQINAAWNESPERPAELLDQYLSTHKLPNIPGKREAS